MVRPQWLQQCVIRRAHVEEGAGNWAVHASEMRAKQEAVGGVSGRGEAGGGDAGRGWEREAAVGGKSRGRK